MPLSETIKPSFLPPLPLRSGLAMTLFNVFMANDRWLKAAASDEPTYTSQVMTGADGEPLHIWRSPIPPQAKGTLIATYGITGSLDELWGIHCSLDWLDRQSTLSVGRSA